MFHLAYTGNTVSLECAIGLIVGGALQVTVVAVYCYCELFRCLRLIALHC